MAEKIKCDCGITFEAEEGQTHCNYCGIKLSDIGKEKPDRLAKERKTTLSEAQKKKIEEEEKYRASVRKDLGEKKKGRGCLVLIGLLIVFFILIGAISSGGEKEKPTPTPAPVKQEEAEAMPETATEEAVRSLEYYQKAVTINETVGTLLEEYGKRVGKWPNLTEEDTYFLIGAEVVIGNVYNEAKSLTPPKIMASPHQKWLKSLELYKQAVATGNKGITRLDFDLIKEAIALMEEGTILMNEAAKEIEEITEKLKQ